MVAFFTLTGMGRYTMYAAYRRKGDGVDDAIVLGMLQSKIRPMTWLRDGIKSYSGGR